jgi:hypothetical protein
LIGFESEWENLKRRLKESEMGRDLFPEIGESSGNIPHSGHFVAHNSVRQENENHGGKTMEREESEWPGLQTVFLGSYPM